MRLPWFFTVYFCKNENKLYLCTRNAKIAQLVEHNLAKVRVAGSSPVFRSQLFLYISENGLLGWWNGRHARLKIL